MENFEGLRKKRMRDLVLAGKFSRILDLPAPPCKSIIHLLRNDSIDKNTHVTVVERDKRNLAAIRRRFNRFPFTNVRFHQGVVEKCPYFGPYDLVNLDTEVALTHNLLTWIANLNMMPGGQLNVWVTANRARGDYTESLYETFHYTKEGLRAIQKVRRENEEAFQGVSEFQIILAAILYSALNMYDFEMPRIEWYADNVNRMYVYQLKNFQKRKTPKCEYFDDFFVWKKRVWKEDREQYPEREEKLSDLTVAQMCIRAVQTEQMGEKAYASRIMRMRLEDGIVLEKTPKMIKAGWKACVSKICKDNLLRIRVHAFIDKTCGPKLLRRIAHGNRSS
jgi:hypothetical protein